MKKKILAVVLAVCVGFVAYVTAFDYVHVVVNREMVGVSWRTSHHHKFQPLFAWHLK